MGLSYSQLDEVTRHLMLEEVDKDEREGKLNVSDRLSQTGVHEYPEPLRNAIRSGTDVTLAGALNQNGRLNATEQRRKPSGGFTTARVPVTAAETLAEGEFNRFYVRAICRRQLNGDGQLVVHRAKQVQNPRPESEALIGSHPEASKLIEDLRTNIGVDTALNIPKGPNSGLSVEIIKTLSSKN